MFSELFAPVSIGVRTIAKTVRILERNQLKVTIREEAYAQTRKNYGFFALVSNKAEGCFKALRKYRVL